MGTTPRPLPPSCNPSPSWSHQCARLLGLARGHTASGQPIEQLLKLTLRPPRPWKPRHKPASIHTYSLSPELPQRGETHKTPKEMTPCSMSRGDGGAPRPPLPPPPGGSNSSTDLGAWKCLAPGCSGSSVRRGPASSHLPNARARNSSKPCGEDSAANGSEAPSKSTPASMNASPMNLHAESCRLSSSAARRCLKSQRFGQHGEPHFKNESAKTDRHAARCGVSCTSDKALLTATNKEARPKTQPCVRMGLTPPPALSQCKPCLSHTDGRRENYERSSSSTPPQRNRIVQRRSRLTGSSA